MTILTKKNIYYTPVKQPKHPCFQPFNNFVNKIKYIIVLYPSNGCIIVLTFLTHKTNLNEH